jgi:hypothetical protein
MELNREEIIKALECCIKAETWGDCADSGCPACQKQGCYFYLRTDEDNENTIYIEIFKDVLALIKELTEENERLGAEQSKIKRKILMEAASKFAGHSDYHGDTILCKLICMSEGKEVGVAKPIDEVRRKENRADTVRKMQEKIMSYDGGGQ